MDEIVKTKLMEICDVIDGEWHHQFVFSSSGRKEERIVISYPGRCDTGMLHKNEYRESNET